MLPPLLLWSSRAAHLEQDPDCGVHAPYSLKYPHGYKQGLSHHWVNPSSGEGGQMGSSRHNFAAAPPFPDMSTPLDSLVFPGFNDAGILKKTDFQVWSAHQFPHTAPNPKPWRACTCVKSGRTSCVELGVGSSVHSGEADVRKQFCPPHPTLTLNWLHYKSLWLFMLGRNPWAWSGLKAHGLQKNCTSCVGTHIQSQQGHPRSTPAQTPPPTPTLQHQIIIKL